MIKKKINAHSPSIYFKYSSSIRKDSNIKYIYGYVHGFLSDKNSFKGQFIKKHFEKHNKILNLLDLNKNGYESISY